jgi:hypothetical protein
MRHTIAANQASIHTSPKRKKARISAGFEEISNQSDRAAFCWRAYLFTRKHRRKETIGLMLVRQQFQIVTHFQRDLLLGQYVFHRH